MIREFNGVSPKIHETAFIAESADIIGDVEIGPKSSIWYGVIIRGDMNYIRIGANTNIQDGTVIHVDSVGEHWDGLPTLIGDNVTIGHRAVIHACTLEDNSFVAMSATVLDGAVVESGAMVAAGALVTPGKRVLKGQLWGGMPARYMRDLRPEEMASFDHVIEHYIEISEKY
ncbi:MAG: gamma carbonic anhydrase family protein [Alphaproteobacteria bacterium]|nr:gamma carbonic anhydrase family protein [Alphaproteobacteria bacterium]MCZ6849106.1 gamma carbonic anhydrase family protein [Alphaproteobacteria bacterium]